MQTLEHVGFLDVYLNDPGIVCKFTHEVRGHMGTFGCFYCTEQELMDFVLFRSAVLCSCGRFDSELEYVAVEVSYGEFTWHLRYDLKHVRFDYGSD